jgi:hypothetical protein
MKLNRHTLLALLAALALFAPDVAGVAAWLAGLHIAWLAWPVRVLGFVAALLASWPAIRGKVQGVINALEAGDAPGKVFPIAQDPEKR